MNSDGRIRWRMTYDELLHVTRATPTELEKWAQLGAMGPRWREQRDRGKWRHVTRECAQRAVIMSRMVRAGVRLEAAALVASSHKVRDTEPLVATHSNGVRIVIPRENLP